jgi:hypothetical protein
VRWAAGLLAALSLVGLVALAALAGPLVPVAVATPARESESPVDKVLILSLPTLDWALVAEEQPPALTDLLARSALASLSVRTIGPRTSLDEGYATLGAGARAVGAGEGTTLVPDGEVSPPFVASLPEVRASNRALEYGAQPGVLGQALAASGRAGAVVANADVLSPGGAREPHREAALAMMDDQGRVGAGTVGPELSVEDLSVPGSLRTEVEATAAAFSQAWSRADVVLLEASDLARTSLSPASEGWHDQARREALARADELIGAVLDDIDLERHSVVVVAPVSGRPEGDGLTVAALAGPGVDPGLATSASTSRAGYVTLSDVAPTVLAALGLDVPVAMIGTPINEEPGEAGGSGGTAASGFEERIQRLVTADEVASFRDDATGPFSVAFIIFQLLTYGFAAAALAWWPRLAPVVGFAALITLAQPSLTFLSGLVRYDTLGVVGYVLALFGGGALLAGVALALARASAPLTGRARPLVAPLLLVGLTLVVLVGDIVAGGSLQLDTVFGYSPIVAGRFSGYGNLAFAMVSMAALVVVTGGWAVAALVQDRQVPRPRQGWLAGAAMVFVAVVVADGHPAFGADVGGVLALVPAALVALVLLSGARVRLGQGIAIAGATVVVVAAFAAADLARPAAERTHVGRFAAQVLDGGDGVAMVIERKIEANLSLLFSSVWALVIPFALAFLVFLVRRRRGILRRLEAEVPGLWAGVVAGLVLAVLGGALNDSGVAIPAMMLGVLLPYVTVLALNLGSSYPPDPGAPAPARASSPDPEHPPTVAARPGP